MKVTLNFYCFILIVFFSFSCGQKKENHFFNKMMLDLNAIENLNQAEDNPNANKEFLENYIKTEKTKYLNRIKNPMTIALFLKYLDYKINNATTENERLIPLRIFANQYCLIDRIRSIGNDAAAQALVYIEDNNLTEGGGQIYLRELAIPGMVEKCLPYLFKTLNYKIQNFKNTESLYEIVRKHALISYASNKQMPYIEYKKYDIKKIRDTYQSSKNLGLKIVILSELINLNETNENEWAGLELVNSTEFAIALTPKVLDNFKKNTFDDSYRYYIKAFKNLLGNEFLCRKALMQIQSLDISKCSIETKMIISDTIQVLSNSCRVQN